MYHLHLQTANELGRLLTPSCFICLSVSPFISFSYLFHLVSISSLSWVRVLVGARNFSPHHRVQTGPGAHPASCTLGTRDSFPAA